MYYIKKKRERAYQFQAVDESVVCDLLWILFVLSHCFFGVQNDIRRVQNSYCFCLEYRRVSIVMLRIFCMKQSIRIS